MTFSATVIECEAGANRPDLTADNVYDVNVLTQDCTLCHFRATFTEWKGDIAIFDNDVFINGLEFEALLVP